MVIRKECAVCKTKISLSLTDRRASNGAIIKIDGSGRRQIGSTCRDCLNGRLRDDWKNGRRKKTIRAYEKTEFGYLMRKYRNMLSRVSGVQRLKYHLYGGLEILKKEDFYEWASKHSGFKKLFRKYVESGYNRKLAPSVDRIDPKKGYVLDNMQWLTHSKNSAKVRRY